ncbi:SDR family NAD(P)-dependent oxidoreductase [Mesorhizobium sp. ANAO-SY3R2]|uniref:SDR family NAD(P)-dependent oxidoreductase n=1 Tax=Mesorhizobium sp. ANAO-SY3R2 TaxID=3166644 RepID=UPI003671823F
MTKTFDRIVLITGAGSGIGAEAARRLAAPGTALVLHTRKNADGLKGVADVCEASGAATEIVLGDLADPAVPQAMIEAARQRFGRVDQIVSNAAQAARSTLGELRPEDLGQAFDTMPTALLRLVDAAMSDLVASSWGRVVVVSSFVAHIFGTAGIHFPATSAAKGALEALAKSMAVQLAPQGVTVNCVVPGFTRKDPTGHFAATTSALEKAIAVTPTGRLTLPADVAAAIQFLLSRDASQITGQSLHVDGGLTLP